MSSAAKPETSRGRLATVTIQVVRSYYRERKWSNVMLSEAKYLVAFSSRFLAALVMTTFNISRSE